MTTTPDAAFRLPRPTIFVQDKVFLPGTKEVGMSLTLAWVDPHVDLPDDADPLAPTTAGRVYISNQAVAKHGTARAVAAGIEEILPAYLEWVEDQLEKELM